MKKSLTALKHFAISFQYTHHDYLAIKNGQLVNSPTKDNTLLEVINKAISLLTTCTPQEHARAVYSLKLIRSKLELKAQSLFNRIFFNTSQLHAVIERLNRVLACTHADELVNHEKDFRYKFLAILPSLLPVQHAPSHFNEVIQQWLNGLVEQVNVDEWKILKWLSTHVFEAKQVQSLPPEKQWNMYLKIMLGIYQGDHILIEDDELDTKAEELATLGGIVRASSHYELGRKIADWDENGHPIHAGRLYADLIQAEVPHYGITGPHLRHILFHATEMSEINGQLVVGKTARQVENLIKANNLKIDGKSISEVDIKTKRKRHFTALQFEYAPNVEGFNVMDCRNFFSHCIYGYLGYRMRKIFLGEYIANIGPYGYGRSDQVPVILEKLKGID